MSTALTATTLAVSATGFTTIIAPVSGHGFVLTDVFFNILNINATAAGDVTLGSQLVFGIGGSPPTSSIPFFVTNYSSAATAAGFFISNQIFQRSFPSALIAPQGYGLYYETFLLSNITTVNFNISASGFYYV